MPHIQQNSWSWDTRLVHNQVLFWTWSGWCTHTLLVGTRSLWETAGKFLIQAKRTPARRRGHSALVPGKRTHSDTHTGTWVSLAGLLIATNAEKPRFPSTGERIETVIRAAEYDSQQEGSELLIRSARVNLKGTTLRGRGQTQKNTLQFSIYMTL